MSGRRARLVLLALVAFPGLAPAQAVRGAVTNLCDSSAIHGAVVQLLDASGAVVGRTLSDDQGRFRLAAREPGPHRVRATYIGFRPVMSDALQLQAGEDATARLSLQVIPPQLSAVTVTARQACRVYADAGVAAELWDQARTAFTAARLSPTQRRVDVTAVRYQRALDADGKQVLSQTLDVRSGATTQPWFSMPADSLRLLGYVTRSGDGSQTYHAPDLDVLASDVFLEDHCLRVASATSEEVTIAFEPARDRLRIPEIAGTVVLDRRTYELRRMDFRYVNVSIAEQDAVAGGDMTFLHVGPLWAIASWSIRMPVIARRIVSGRAPEDRVLRHQVSGGELVLVLWRSDTLWARPPVTLRVAVVDSATGSFVPNAVIDVRGTGFRATSGGDGHARIEGLLPGVYVLTVANEDMQTLGLSHDTRVMLTSGTGLQRVALPSLGAVLSRLCPALPATHGVIVGRARRMADTTPIRLLSVAAQWDEYSLHESGGVVATRKPQAVTAVTRADGGFTLCGTPLGTRVRVVTPWDDRQRDTAATRLTAPSRIARLELRVEPPLGAYRGTVVDATDRRPLDDVEIVVPSANLTARTAHDGSFRFDAVPGGQLDIVFRRNGYSPIVRRHAFVRDTVVKDQVRPEKMGSRIATVAAGDTATSRPDVRPRRSSGHLITREQLQRDGHRRLSEVLSRVPGLRIVSNGGAAWAATARGGAPPDLAGLAQGTTTAGAAACYCDVYLDRTLLYAYTPNSTPVDLNAYSPDALDAVEFFNAAEVPAEFGRMGAVCGVLLLWSRGPR